MSQPDKRPLDKLTPAGWRLHLAVAYSSMDRPVKVSSADLRELLSLLYDFDYHDLT